MKSILLSASLLAGLAGYAFADAAQVAAFDAAWMGTQPVPVTYRPKSITADTTLTSVEQAFTNSTAGTPQKLANGDSSVVLSNVSNGVHPNLSGPDTKTNQTTTLTVVVGPDGKIKSYDMVQTVATSNAGSDEYSVTTTDLGNSCFSDCSTSASSIVAGQAAANAKGTTPPNTIPVVTNQTSVVTTNPVQQAKSAVSPSAP